MARAKHRQTSVTLQALMSTGQGEFLHKTFEEATVERHAATELVLLQVASFLRRELPIRFAHRVRDLEGVPLLSEISSVQGVRDLYVQSGVDLLNFTPKKLESVDDEERFAALVESIYERHSKVLVQMARGAFEFRRNAPQDDFALQNQIHNFLDRFYMSRIGIRVLIGQYLALRQPPVENYVGIICSQTSPYEIVKRAIDDAAFMCTRKYGDAPEVIMTGRLDLTFPYVPTHLRTYTHTAPRDAICFGKLILC
jgi:pyruvate dehydrogenase kinase 2/3/4